MVASLPNISRWTKLPNRRTLRKLCQTGDSFRRIGSNRGTHLWANFLGSRTSDLHLPGDTSTTIGLRGKDVIEYDSNPCIRNGRFISKAPVWIDSRKPEIQWFLTEQLDLPFCCCRKWSVQFDAFNPFVLGRPGADILEKSVDCFRTSRRVKVIFVFVHGSFLFND